jgi:hypothetical protein
MTRHLPPAKAARHKKSYSLATIHIDLLFHILRFFNGSLTIRSYDDILSLFGKRGKTIVQIFRHVAFAKKSFIPKGVKYYHLSLTISTTWTSKRFDWLKNWNALQSLDVSLENSPYIGLVQYLTPNDYAELYEFQEWDFGILPMLSLLNTIKSFANLKHLKIKTFELYKLDSYIGLLSGLRSLEIVLPCLQNRAFQNWDETHFANNLPLLTKLIHLKLSFPLPPKLSLESLPPFLKCLELGIHVPELFEVPSILPYLEELVLVQIHCIENFEKQVIRFFEQINVPRLTDLTLRARKLSFSQKMIPVTIEKLSVTLYDHNAAVEWQEMILKLSPNQLKSVHLGTTHHDDTGSILKALRSQSQSLVLLELYYVEIDTICGTVLRDPRYPMSLQTIRAHHGNISSTELKYTQIAWELSVHVSVAVHEHQLSIVRVSEDVDYLRPYGRDEERIIARPSSIEREQAKLVSATLMHNYRSHFNTHSTAYPMLLQD